MEPNWEDDVVYSGSSSVTMESRTFKPDVFGTAEAPDVLYSVNYVDQSHRLYGSMYTNKNKNKK